MVMMVRKLAWSYSDEFGCHGWMPKWLEHLGFEPSWDYGISHDIMEHQVDRIGGAEGEFMAFGAMLLVRGESGYFFTEQDQSIENILPRDFPDILDKIERGSQTLKDPGRTYKLGNGYEDWDTSISLIINRGFQITNDDYGTMKDFPIPISEAKRRIMGWMRKGFRKAHAFYCKKHRLHPEELGYIFKQITEVVEKKSKHAEQNDTLVIRINLDRGDVFGELISWYDTVTND